MKTVSVVIVLNQNSIQELTIKKTKLKLIRH